MSEPRIVPITTAEVTISQASWPFARAHASDIDTHWRQRTAQQPKLFNGDVLLLRAWSLEAGHFRGECLQTDFKSFLFWREHDAPDHSVLDFFAAATLHTNEGWLVLGRMGPHHSNPGLVYMPCGSLHPDDAVGGIIDLDGSIIREVEEETGLTLLREQLGPASLIFDGPRLVLVRRVALPCPAAEIAAKVRRYLTEIEDPELSDIVLVKRSHEVIAQMPPYMAAYIRASLP